MTLRGQSLVEYLLVATLVIAAILFVQRPVGVALEKLFGNTKDKIQAEADRVKQI